MASHEELYYLPTHYYSSWINQYIYLFSLSGQKVNTSPIDSTIIDFILDHYNVLTLQGKPAILTSEQFDDLVIEAKEYYYKKLLKEQNENIRN